MKWILFFYPLFVTVSTAIGQIDRGQVSYEFITGTVEWPELNKGEIIYTFAPGVSRTETTLGVMGTDVKIVQQQPYRSLTLFPIGEANFAIQSNLSNPESATPDIVISDETKMICGYTCRKAIMTRNGKVYTVWFTTDIVSNVQGQEVFYGYDGNNGFPLQITSNSNGILITVAAKQISMTVPLNSFDLSVPSGYEVITKEQIEEKLIETSRK